MKPHSDNVLPGAKLKLPLTMPLEYDNDVNGIVFAMERTYPPETPRVAGEAVWKEAVFVPKGLFTVTTPPLSARANCVFQAPHDVICGANIERLVKVSVPAPSFTYWYKYKYSAAVSNKGELLPRKKELSKSNCPVPYTSPVVPLR